MKLTREIIMEKIVANTIVWNKEESQDRAFIYVDDFVNELLEAMNYTRSCEMLPDIKEIIIFAKEESDRLEKSKLTTLDKKGYMFGIIDGARWIKEKLTK